jgi:CopG-like RHH_1 or ribbon-helix-helix domain, RHH_5
MLAPTNGRTAAFRKPRRMTITLPHATYVELERRSCEQGRSLSNLSAYLLECAVNDKVLTQEIPDASKASTTSNRGR